MKKQYNAPEVTLQQLEMERMLAASDVNGTLPGFTPGSFTW